MSGLRKVARVLWVSPKHTKSLIPIGEAAIEFRRRFAGVLLLTEDFAVSLAPWDPGPAKK
jgi:hypothetical protein